MIVLCCMLSMVVVNSRVDSVVLYSDRVMVTRIADISIGESTELTFADLPGALEDNSVRISAQGLKVGEVQVLRGYVDKPHPKVRHLEDSIAALQISDRRFADELSVLKEKEKFLQSITVGGPELISKEIYSGKVSSESWRQGLRFMVDELIATKKRMAEIERLRNELQKEISIVARELNDTKATVANRKSIVFGCHPDSPRNYRIRVSYILRGASWRTYYEVRADPSMKTIDFAYFSKILNRTNEDWDNTKVVLSTAKPSLGGSQPMPVPWYVRSRDKGLQALTRGARTENAITATAHTAPIAVAEAPIEAGVSVWYPLPGRYTVKSGEPEKRLQLLQTAFEGHFKYYIIPRVSLLAYLTGEMQNKSEFLFLPGEASTYVGDDFTGKVNMPTIAPDESTTVSFGIDDRVRVERDLKKSKVSQGGLFTGKTKHEFTYENRVKNFHNKEVECTIIDQVPVPQDPDIKVSSIRLEPKPTEEDKDRGFYYWRIPIGAGTEYKITVSFTVEVPANREIEGLLP
jgi:uncharacterized protein (TIGR02231 family)